MPDRADSALDICSRASLLIGGDAISSFTAGGTAEAEVANAIYEDIAVAALTQTRWRFATKQATLVKNVTDPTSRWDSAHDLPSDLLMLSAVTVNDMPIKYDVYGDQVYSDSTSSDVVVADYIYRASESDWPSYFTMAVQFQVASVLALSVARDATLAGAMEAQGERQMVKARRLDSQQQTTRKLVTSRFITDRRS